MEGAAVDTIHLPILCWVWYPSVKHIREMLVCQHCQPAHSWKWLPRFCQMKFSFQQKTTDIFNFKCGQCLNFDHLWVLNIRWCTDLWKPSKKLKVLQVLAALKLLFWMVSRNSQKTNNPHQAKQHKTTAPRVQMRMLFGCEPWAYPTQKVGKVRITRTSTICRCISFLMFHIVFKCLAPQVWVSDFWAQQMRPGIWVVYSDLIPKK